MSEIKIRRPHSMPHARARKEAEKVAVQLKEKFELDYSWDGDRIHFKRSGVTGFMLVGRDEVQLEAKLAGLLGFLKPAIEGHINDNLDRVFGDDAPAAPAARDKAKAPSKPAKK